MRGQFLTDARRQHRSVKQSVASVAHGKASTPRPSPNLATPAIASHVLALQRQVGNRATVRILARAPETWYRGEAPSVGRAKIGGSVHDLTDGLYFIDSAQAAQGYADLRAGKPGGGNTLAATFDRRLLGKVLDLPADPRWARFLASKPPVASMGETWGHYMARGTELYNNGFHEFLRQNKLQLSQYDAIIAEDLIRNPKARQLVIVNEKIAERIDDMLTRVDIPSVPIKPPPARPAPTSPPPSAKSGSAPGGDRGGSGAGAGGKAVKEGGEAAAEAATSPKFYRRLAAKLGRIGMEVVDGLVPDPLDALELMYDFAGSYKEAWDRIKRDNLTTGFAIGLAAYLVIPRWEWAKYYARTTVSRDVATQVLGAVGIAENAFNDGLVRGFIYGEKHSTAQADRLRQKAFDALVKAGRMPGRYEGDDVYTFGRDDVYSFAAALQPTAVSVLKEADRRKAARIEAEKLREETKRWSRPPTVGYKL
jgi:hypothetical protein